MINARLEAEIDALREAIATEMKALAPQAVPAYRAGLGVVLCRRVTT
jgi:hypothetical protein